MISMIKCKADPRCNLYQFCSNRHTKTLRVPYSAVSHLGIASGQLTQDVEDDSRMIHFGLMTLSGKVITMEDTCNILQHQIKCFQSCSMF